MEGFEENGDSANKSFEELLHSLSETRSKARVASVQEWLLENNNYEAVISRYVYNQLSFVKPEKLADLLSALNNSLYHLLINFPKHNDTFLNVVSNELEMSKKALYKDIYSSAREAIVNIKADLLRLDQNTEPSGD